MTPASAPNSAPSPLILAGPLTIDMHARLASIAGEELSLTALQFDLLVIFVRSAGKVLGFEEVLTMLERLQTGSRDPSSFATTSTLSLSVHEAGVADEALLENLLQLYVHDLSAIFTRVELGADGRFAYPELSSYLTAAPEKSGFVLRVDGRIAGFALVRRGSPAVPKPDVWDVAEFFVLRRYRRLGVGRAAALQLWQQLGGSWTVRVANENPAALSFWKRAVAEYSGRVDELSWSSNGESWTVFHLQPNA